MQTRLFGSQNYFNRAKLEATNPSRKEGIDAATEARWRSTTSRIVKTAIKALKLPDWVYETTMNYVNRFFMTRSINKNDRHLVVGGAILLASKVQESPRSVQDVAYVLLMAKTANKQKPQQAPDQNTLEHFKEGVVMAEQCMLFSSNFNLNVESHVSLARRLLEPLDLWAKASPAPEEADANQLKLQLYRAVITFLNDSALTNLSLQFPNCQIAPVTLVMAAKRIAAARYASAPLPPALQRALALGTDAEWFGSKGLTLEMAADIESQINELYSTAPTPAPAQSAAEPQQAPPAGGSGAAPPALLVQQPQQPQADGPAAAPADAPEDGELPANGKGSGAVQSRAVAEASPSRPGSPERGAASVAAGGSQYRPGQPSSSVAVEPANGGMATAGNTPEQPHVQSHLPQQQERASKRVSDGDECDQQATSELHDAPPEQQAEAGAGQAACPAYNAQEDSANVNCSPNGLTNGNASGSGCGHVGGQPEVCSGPGVPCTCPQQQRAAKRGRDAEVEGSSADAAAGDTADAALQCKARRVEDVPEAMLMQQQP